MKCPKCGNDYCKIQTESKTTGKDYSLGKGLAGSLFFGSAGFILGFSNSRNVEVKTYWSCPKCGNQFSS